MDSELIIDLENSSWTEFYNALISAESLMKVKERGTLLKLAQGYFSSNPSFFHMDYEIRKRIAGLDDEGSEGVNWLFFGSMRGAGRFWQGIRGNYAKISDALDFIPLTGPITKNDFANFIDLFIEAYQDYQGGAGLSTATRLLAIRRPDYFLCVDKENINGITKFFNVPKSMSIKHKELYWDEIVVKCQEMPWWKSKQPKEGVELLAWVGRVAMLDCIFYSINFY